MLNRSEFEFLHKAQLSGEPESEWDTGEPEPGWEEGTDMTGPEPAVPEKPGMPEGPQMPQLPGTPDIPQWGPPPATPEMPGMPGGPQMPQVPQRPQRPQRPPQNQRPPVPPMGPGPWIPQPPQWDMPQGPGPEIQPPVQEPMPGQFASVRFIHAAVGQPDVDIAIDNSQVISAVQYGELTEYFMSRAGRVTVTIRLAEGSAILNQTSFDMESGGMYTIAVVNAAAGIALFLMEDLPCRKSVYNSCIRAVNLTNQSPALDVLLSGSRLLFSNVGFLDVTEYKQISPGAYDFSLARSGACPMQPSVQPRGAVQIIPIVIGATCRSNILVTAQRMVEQDRVYTMYIIGNAYTQPYLNIVLAESYFEY